MGLLSLAPRGSGYALALLAVPFAGVLVRYRVDYRPKDGRVQLGEEEEYGAPGKRWLKSGYVEMTRRVYRLEVRAAGAYFLRDEDSAHVCLVCRDGPAFRRASVRTFPVRH